MPDEALSRDLPPRTFRRRRSTNPLAYQNAPERQFVARAKQNGWHASKLGWPDFLCVDRKGDFHAVEVKRAAHHRLRPSQRFAIYLLARAGVTCWKWTPDGGFERLDLTAAPPPEYANLLRTRGRTSP
jgi:hypothetical protein